MGISKRSYSQFLRFGQCPRKAELAGKYEPKVKAEALAEGEVFHKALEEMYRSGSVSQALEKVRALREETLSKVSSTGLGQESVDRISSKFDRLEVVLEGYSRSVFPKDMERYEILDCEKEFSVEIDSGVVLHGFVDGVWRDRESGVRFIVEHKYKSSVEEELIPLDLQVSLYTLALIPEYGHLPTLYNVVLKPALRVGRSETREEFRKRLQSHVFREASTFRWTHGDFSSKLFVRRVYSRSKNELRVALLQSRAMNRVMEMYERDPTLVWRNVGDHCLYSCPYIPICIEEDPLLVERFYDLKKEHRP